MEKIIHTDYRNNRQFRKKISELRSQGEIYICVNGTNTYKHWDICSQEEREHYTNQIIKSWKTQYFNTIVPIKRKLKEEKQRELLGDIFAEMEVSLE